ncbi:Cathepsin B-like cysteine proteinase 3 [Caenorhabditis elegans]|uniref:Cathepsin B-like cysteine proteinase 3 n=1 Tax=Caenorhabditis elegans TaxID=6239 RepID=CPR3_CAEEL|nr:Cathepsin B-like cysteine proteinase 3 [Caenorhabditis elegans]P43507.1 RecName: Full=Cathepsin B-like cysteine proteinase 3; AltName: Full=Cysteine protease-related 3; Flags: Precursor [Caenorhabditis elegans]AAA98782.1 cathepsin B-like cysteine proteinase [Caenorhabditis elegans]AAA98788.1 cathepsin B-like cysteine proteinase [Caenorhabditis elegans]CAB61032.2 Cathepsin B-like cysteine proteinase 3 [Caenorhabditis elegans]|eukprot:NP_506790.1 Cathepsin B-like cysteine proteinase 3 [Caenorhabditis elegans]
MLKVYFLALFLAGCSAFVLDEIRGINIGQSPQKVLVDHVNTVQTSWVAEHNEISEFEMKFKVMDVKFAEPLEKDSDVASELFVRGEIVPEPLPDTFDAREKWPDCNTIKLIRNQATCGSCWAFGAAEVISDRVCIQSNGTQQPVISVEDILSCCGTTCGYGCKGGYSIEALRFWASSGAVTGGDYGGHGCMPYSFAPCTKNCPESTTPSCKTTCQSSYKTEEYKKDKHYGASAYKVTTTKSVTEIQTEIYHYGPVEASYKVYEDFYHYKSGVYHYTSGKLVGGHAVKIIGWGVENGVDYWLIANSWGTSFGEKGFFKIRRGTNECQIEGNVVAGIAKLGTHSETYEDDGGAATSCSFIMCTLMVLTYYFV